MTLNDLARTDWHGTAELWLDPMGNVVHTSDCTLHVTANGIRYEWQYEGAPHQGTIDVNTEGGVFQDSWHSPTPMRCRQVDLGPALVDLLGSYGAGEGPEWGWRLMLSLRPPFAGATESLVLQMTNITPWGEEARAVRMTAARR